MSEVTQANVGLQTMDEGFGLSQQKAALWVGMMNKLANRVEDLDAVPGRPQPDLLLLGFVVVQCRLMKIVQANMRRQQETGIGVDHRPFSSFRAAVKLTLGFSRAEISRAWRSSSARVLRGRWPALVTTSAGLPLSVTMTDWPARRAFTMPGE